MTSRFRRMAAVAAAGVMVAATLTLPGGAQAATQNVGPIFIDGQALIVPEFSDSDGWIRQQLWVETEFDTDGDGELDRMHVDVTRPGQTESEGLRVPVVYETSPYYAGTASTQSQYFWNVNHELGQAPPPRLSPPPITHRDSRTFVSNSEVNTWVPRGFAVVHSDSPAPVFQRAARRSAERTNRWHRKLLSSGSTAAPRVTHPSTATKRCMQIGRPARWG